MKPFQLCRVVMLLAIAVFITPIHAASPERISTPTTSGLDSLAKATGRHSAPATQVRNQDTTRNPSNVVFNQTGVFVNAASAFPADRYAWKLPDTTA